MTSTPAIGEAVKRREDFRFLKGLGRYTDDISLPRQTYCYFIRSNVAHAEIGDRPVLWHVMTIYAAQGFTEFLLALGYGGDAIKRYSLEYDWRSSDFVLELGNGGVGYLSPNAIAGWRDDHNRVVSTMPTRRAAIG